MSPAPRPDPVPLRDALAELGRGLGLPSPEVLGGLTQAWVETAGEALAMHARPRSLRDGVLAVAVDSPAWATQVRYLAGDLIAGLSERLGEGVARELRIVVEGR